MLGLGKIKNIKGGGGLYSNDDLSIRHLKQGGGGGDRVNRSSGISLEKIFIGTYTGSVLYKYLPT